MSPPSTPSYYRNPQLSSDTTASSIKQSASYYSICSLSEVLSGVRSQHLYTASWNEGEVALREPYGSMQGAGVERDIGLGA